MLGDKCRTVYGDTSNKAKIQNIKDFKEGRVQYLIANPASADKGLTLTNCHICIYFSLSWSYELFKQSMDRIYGDKSIQPYECTYYIMMAKGTVDTVLYREVLLGKQTLSYAILDHLKADDYD
jgi:SNF2 family DNA or RNA helicase